MGFIRASSSRPIKWCVSSVNRAWIELFTEFIGPNQLRPEQLAKAFAYRSYFNMGAIGDIFELLGMPRDALEMLLGLPSDTKPGFRPGPGTLRHLPRMVTTIAGKTRYGGAITAALLLAEFVDDVPWAHLDIAGPAWATDVSGYTHKGGTGYGVRTLVELARGLAG